MAYAEKNSEQEIVMRLTIDIWPEEEAALRAKAKAEGLSVRAMGSQTGA
jgi:hypothetical protein